MFEKEAEERITEQYGTSGEYITRQRIWQDGAEFGYNKANEWHYVKDGDLPKDNCKVYLYAKDKECYIGFLENGAWKYEGGFYASDNFVIAWKEIVLPELKEIE